MKIKEGREVCNDIVETDALVEDIDSEIQAILNSIDTTMDEEDVRALQAVQAACAKSPKPSPEDTLWEKQS